MLFFLKYLSLLTDDSGTQHRATILLLIASIILEEKIFPPGNINTAILSQETLKLKKKLYSFFGEKIAW